LGLREPEGRGGLVVANGHDLKLVFPQSDAPPAAFEGLEFARCLLQPMDGPDRVRNTKLAIEYCSAHPQWHLSLQTHKWSGIP
jgi:7-carboxy-7-deazaguanine synthase